MSERPDKQKVRDWLKHRHEPGAQSPTTVQTPEEIRRELGWELTENPQKPQDEPD